MSGAAVKINALGLLWPKRAEVPLESLTDDVLVDRARAGDRPAFAEIVRRNQGRVRGLLLRLCRDAVVADDLAQEVFFRVYRGLVGFQQRSALGTWIYRITYNVYLNHRARVRTFEALPEDYERQVPTSNECADPRRSDLRRDLMAAIDTLPERYRAPVLLYYVEELPYPEIARILELPLGTVKTHLHRARRLLREHLDPG